jgi:hypothetical protein
MFKICLLIVFLAGMQLHLNGQCPGNALWLNGENDGIMKDPVLIGGSVMVYASTSGTMSNGRPLYRTTGSVWKALHYGGSQVWNNRFSLESPSLRRIASMESVQFYWLQPQPDSNAQHRWIPISFI